MLNPTGTITGKIGSSAALIGKVDTNINLSGKVAMGGLPPTYTGDYEVTPEAHNEVILETAAKLMSDNVTVHKVPYFETSNPYGETVYIASEVN